MTDSIKCQQDVCVNCKTQLEEDDDGHLYCPNQDCPVIGICELPKHPLTEQERSN